MASGLYLCYEDINGFRGYIPPQTPYILRQISNNKYWLETDAVTALINVGSRDGECDHYTEREKIGLVSKEDDALKWLICGDATKFIGANKC